VELRNEGLGKKHLIHRLVAQEFIEQPGSGFFVDHIDRNKLNNSVTNLRYVTSQQNQMNKTKQQNATSIYKGVSFDKHCRKWLSLIHFNGKKIRLGLFAHEQEAAIAYNAKASELFGEYANLNVID
jgi:hypothetical protein